MECKREKMYETEERKGLTNKLSLMEQMRSEDSPKKWLKTLDLMHSVFDLAKKLSIMKAAI